MQTLMDEIIRGKHRRDARLIEFSPLDLFVMGHHTHGPIFGFERAIDLDRFQSSLRKALDANPEMGVALEVDEGGKHFMRTESGVQLMLQRAPGPMPSCQRIAALPLNEFPLAHSSMDARRLIKDKLPLLGFRITVFDDGGCTLGIRTTHSHLDGISLIDFLVNLGEIYNGAPVHAAQVGRDVIPKLARGSGVLPSDALHFVPVTPEMASQHISHVDANFAHTQIIFDQDLFENYVGKVRAEKAGIRTADVICALAWKAWALSSNLPAFDDFRVYSIFNLRQMKGWPLGRHFLGNAVIDRRASLDLHALQNRSIAEIANGFRRQTKPLKAEEVGRDIGFLTRLRDQGAYREDGSYIGYERAFMRDMATKRALNVNDLRFLQLHKVRFESPALWYESGQDFPGIQGYVEVTQRPNGDAVFHYHCLAEEADAFEWELRKLVSSAYIYS